ncbi:MAG: hypothetical protein EOR84_26485 [Mesorhizobium sp.]|nr:hypothetical protein [Mesorhizobium sp.]RWM88734.1 MAG: hypothetical protein EOR84_26485 [Mesorhizobium sp.]
MTQAAFARAQQARPLIVACTFLAVLAVGIGIMFPATFSGSYYMQQLQIAAFVGVLASGTMAVLLLGEIDLSLPWTVTTTGMLACGIASSDASWAGEGSAFLFAMLWGVTVGAVNAFGVAILRAPSMVWTLGVNAILLGLTVLYAGGYSPQTNASPVMRFLAVGRLFETIPVALILWAAIGTIFVFLLKRTVFGSWLYAMGRSPRVAFLAGVPTRAVVFAVFIWSASVPPSAVSSWPVIPARLSRRWAIRCCCPASRRLWSAAQRSPAARAPTRAP